MNDDEIKGLLLGVVVGLMLWLIFYVTFFVPMDTFIRDRDKVEAYYCGKMGFEYTSKYINGRCYQIVDGYAIEFEVREINDEYYMVEVGR